MGLVIWMVLLVKVGGDGEILCMCLELSMCANFMDRIFIIEGLPTVVMGVATLWLLPNNPEHVSLPTHRLGSHFQEIRKEI